MFVENQFDIKAKTAEVWIVRATELKRAYDSLRRIADSARQRNEQRLLAAAQQLADTPHKSRQPGSQQITSEEESDFQDEHLEPVALMLLALAIENLLKSVLARRSLITVEKKTLSIPGAGDHDLAKLAHRCDIAVNEHEKTAIKVLSHYGSWAGRYMIPRKLERYREFWLHQVRGETHPENETLQQLFERIYSLAKAVDSPNTGHLDQECSDQDLQL